jgi:hypothetical protein
MADAQDRRDLSSMLEQRRRALLQRPGVSERVQHLSESGSRHPLNPRRARRPTLLMGLIAGGALTLMLVCGIAAVALVVNGLWLHSQLSSPTVTAQSFFSALHQQDFASAYSYLSDDAKSHISEATFAAKFQAYDQVNGIVESYPVASSKTNGNIATVQVYVTRSGSDGEAVAETLNFVKQGSDWRINGTSPPLWA